MNCLRYFTKACLVSLLNPFRWKNACAAFREAPLRSMSLAQRFVLVACRLEKQNLTAEKESGCSHRKKRPDGFQQPRIHCRQ